MYQNFAFYVILGTKVQFIKHLLKKNKLLSIFAVATWTVWNNRSKKNFQEMKNQHHLEADLIEQAFNLFLDYRDVNVARVDGWENPRREENAHPTI